MCFGDHLITEVYLTLVSDFPPFQSAASPRTRHLPSQSLASAALMSSPASKRLLKVRPPLKKKPPKGVETVDTWRSPLIDILCNLWDIRHVIVP